MRKFQVKLLAGLLGVFSGSLAYGSALNETTSTTVYVSGSSAFQKGFALAIKTICEPNTLEAYQDSTKNAKAYFCKAKTGDASVDGTLIQIRFTIASTVIGDNDYGTVALGGSILGVSPVAYQQKVNFLALGPNLAGVTLTGSPTTDPISSPATFAQSPTALEKVVPQLGISDLYPDAFVGQNAPAQTGGISSDSLSKLTAAPGPIQIFNTPVTKVLRDRLQAIQFANGSLGASCTSITSDADKEQGACTPSLTASAIANIFSGTWTKWSDVDPGLTGDAINIVRREIGSGTQAALNLVAMSEQYAQAATKAYPCVAGATPAVLNTSNVYSVGATSDQVVTKLNELNTASKFGIGLLDTTKSGNGENVATASASSGLRYINIDKTSPTLLNVASGSYKFIAQSTLNTNNVEYPKYSAAQKAILNSLVRNLQDSTVIAGANALIKPMNMGQGGILVASRTSCSTAAGCLASPETAYRFAADPAAEPKAYCTAPKATW